jgi:hypothetical protein
MSRTLANLLGSVLCAVVPATCLDQSAPTAPAARAPAPSSDRGHTPDGTTGWARIQTAAGVSLLPYVARAGHAIHQDDVDLGPIMNVDARLYGGTIWGATERWPDDTVAFRFHPAFVGTARSVVRTAMAELERTEGVHFVEHTEGEPGGAFVEIKWGPRDAWYAGLSTAIGMAGSGEPHCSVHDGCRSDGGQWIYFRGGAELAPDTARHQLEHALGRLHLTARRSTVSPLATL